MNEMVKPVVIAITGTQALAGQEPERLQLVTEGSYCYEPGFIRFSYVESEMTGMEGVVTSFTIEDEKKITLLRTGKVNAELVFVLGQRHESLLNEHGGIFDFSYEIDVEHSGCGVNSYHVEIREA